MSPSPFLPFSPLKERSSSRRFAVEGLEPRWLLSATPVAAALQAAWPAPEQDALWQDAAATTPAAVLASPAQLDLSQATPAGAWTTGQLADPGPASLLEADSANALQGRLTQVYAQARLAVNSYLGAHSAQDLLALFPGDATQPNEWGQTEAVRQQWLQGAGEVTLTLASSEQMGGAMAAFTARGPSGGAEVFVNRQWLKGLATDADLLRVLVEELGHGLDSALNGEHDSPGDEGELFAAHVLALPLEPAQRQRIALEDDHALLWWGLSSYAVEQSSFSSNQSIADGRLPDANTTITGSVTLTSTYTNVGNSANDGRMVIGIQNTPGVPLSYLDGDSDASQVADHLTIKATGVVQFYSAIGYNDPLESLTITASTVTPTGLPGSVIFDQDVVLTGPLVIDTDGVVTFSRKLTITGGSLTIRGASLIEFNDTVNVNGGN
ncbi:MAG: LEPR-XLL domain-containing protein, partial [Betaproteobacteria bacterium]